MNANDAVERTKKLVRQVVIAATGYNDQSMAVGAITDHLIDGLAAELKRPDTSGEAIVEAQQRAQERINRIIDRE